MTFQFVGGCIQIVRIEDAQKGRHSDNIKDRLQWKTREGKYNDKNVIT